MEGFECFKRFFIFSVRMKRRGSVISQKTIYIFDIPTVFYRYPGLDETYIGD